jgi:hypothetical protein
MIFWFVSKLDNVFLVSATKRKIVLAGDACSKPLITIRFHDLHVSDIKTKRKIVLAGDACSKPLITIRFHDLHVSDIRTKRKIVLVGACSKPLIIIRFHDLHVGDIRTKRKIMLTGDACSKPLITIRFHDLHVGNIRRAMGEITSYHERLAFSFFLVLAGYAYFGPFMAFLFCFGHRFLIELLCLSL